MENTTPPESTHLCRRCQRKLKNEASTARGMGETCYKKWLAENQRKKLFSVDSLQSIKNSI